jgi:hypothetical protein
MKLNLLISAIVFAAAIFAFIYFVQSREDAETARQKAIAVEAEGLKNKSIRDVEFVDVRTDKDLTSEILSGDVFVIVLVSSCEACTKEVEMMSGMTFDGTPKVFGIMIESRQRAEMYIEKNNINFPVVMIKEGKISDVLNVKYFPTNLRLMDGKITNVQFGSFASTDMLRTFLSKF